MAEFFAYTFFKLLGGGGGVLFTKFVYRKVALKNNTNPFF